MSYFLAASLVKLRNEVNSIWPNRSKVSDGWIGDAAHSARKSDHNPDWSAPGRRRGVVRALDITVRGIDVDLLLKHTTNDSRVAYVIYNRRIYTHSRGWYRYNGSNPHTSHVHVSIAHTNTAENDLKTWISSVSSSKTSTASKPKSSSSSSSATIGQARTNRDKVPVHSHRDSSGDRQIDTLHNKGYRVNIVERSGSWVRIRNSKGPGGNGWVAAAHLDGVPDPKDEWPDAALPRTASHTTDSHNAWVKLLGDVGYKDKSLTVAFQKWLRDLGRYQGTIDGNFGPRTVRALQRFLSSKGLYKGVVDGQRGPMTIRAEIDYLNDQAQYY